MCWGRELSFQILALPFLDSPYQHYSRYQFLTRLDHFSIWRDGAGVRVLGAVDLVLRFWHSHVWIPRNKISLVLTFILIGPLFNLEGSGGERDTVLGALWLQNLEPLVLNLSVTFTYWY